MAEHQLDENASNKSINSIRKFNSFSVELVNKLRTNDHQSFTRTNTSNLKSSNLSSNEQIILNDYVLLRASDSESNGSAYHTKKKKNFSWKRFNKREYMNKLECYLIMESSTSIYKFVEIITDTTDSYVYVMFEEHYGDLHSYMKEKKCLDEAEASRIFKQCVEIVDECHQNGIIVRDIKLKKFVFLDALKTKLGLANLEDCLILDEDATDDLIKNQQGCPAYVSPEILKQSTYSGKLSDSWSLGIVLYLLLIGRYPFYHQNIQTMCVKISRGKFIVPPSTGLSLDARILLRSLIRVNPEERPYPDEILAHNWFKQPFTPARITPVSMAFNYITNLNSNANIPVQPTFQHKPIGAAFSAPGSIGISQSRFAFGYRSVPHTQIN